MQARRLLRNDTNFKVYQIKGEEGILIGHLNYWSNAYLLFPGKTNYFTTLIQPTTGMDQFRDFHVMLLIVSVPHLKLPKNSQM